VGGGGAGRSRNALTCSGLPACLCSDIGAWPARCTAVHPFHQPAAPAVPAVPQDDGEDDTVVKKKSRKRAWEEDGEGACRRPLRCAALVLQQPSQRRLVSCVPALLNPNSG
jgi:hypothetical protein